MTDKTYPCIEEAEWTADTIEFHVSKDARIDVTLGKDGSLTIHGSAWGGGALLIEPKVSNEIVVRLRNAP